MHSTTVSAKGEDWAVVGEGMILSGAYDRHQLWFSFMERAAFRLLPIESPPPAYTKANIPNEPFARKPATVQKTMPPDDSTNQMVLRFSEFRRVTRSQYKTLKKQKFPNWDKDENGEPYSIILAQKWANVSNEDRNQIAAWCRDQLSRRFAYISNHIVCESKKDAVLVRLKYG